MVESGELCCKRLNRSIIFRLIPIRKFGPAQASFLFTFVLLKRTFNHFIDK